MFPELGPTLAEVTADENIGMIAGLFVCDAEAVPRMPSHLTGGEFIFHEPTRESDDDDGFRRRNAVAALPKGVDAADGLWQSVARAIKIDSSGLTVIGAEDTQVGAIILRQRIADLCDGLN